MLEPNIDRCITRTYNAPSIYYRVPIRMMARAAASASAWVYAHCACGYMGRAEEVSRNCALHAGLVGAKEHYLACEDSPVRAFYF